MMTQYVYCLLNHHGALRPTIQLIEDVGGELSSGQRVVGSKLPDSQAV